MPAFPLHRRISHGRSVGFSEHKFFASVGLGLSEVLQFECLCLRGVTRLLLLVLLENVVIFTVIVAIILIVTSIVQAESDKREDFLGRLHARFSNRVELIWPVFDTPKPQTPKPSTLNPKP